MAEITSKCQHCGSIYTILFGDRCMSGELIRSESHGCQQCGMTMEGDGNGLLPDEMRKAMLSQHGEWGLGVRSGSKPIIAKVLRKVSGMSLSEVSSLLKEIPGVLLKGTQAEMEVYKYYLDKENGIESFVECISA